MTALTLPPVLVTTLDAEDVDLAGLAAVLAEATEHLDTVANLLDALRYQARDAGDERQADELHHAAFTVAESWAKARTGLTTLVGLVNRNDAEDGAAPGAR